MRIISKQVSLENFTSRLPGIVPSYRDRDGKVYYFDDESLKRREYTFPSNYGLVPMNVNIDGNCYSWETISSWYQFFTDYYHLLNDWGHCGIKYSAATEYYANESKNGYADQMVYGSLETDYINLDNIFNERSGKTMYETIQMLVPTMDIPSGYTDYWHTTKLFYPDIIRWNGWFGDRYPMYSGNTLDDCSGETNCCDCTEYIYRGGNEMYSGLTSAYTKIQDDIAFVSGLTCERNSTEIGSCIDACSANCCSSFIIPISLQVSIDDMGEFSIFSEEYQVGRDYRGCNYGDTDNTRTGTVVAISGHAMSLVDGSGFGYDPVYMERVFSGDCWDLHEGKVEIDGIPEEDSATTYYQYDSPTGFYGFKFNYEKVSGLTDDFVRSAITEVYDVTPMYAMFINGIRYDIFEQEYGYYNGDSAKTFYVYREDYTETPYTTINGKKIYADAMPQSKDRYFYFPFFLSGETESKYDSCGNPLFNIDRYKWFPRERGNDTRKFIMYGGAPLYLSADTITVDDIEYSVVTGMFNNEDGEFFISPSGGTERVYSIDDQGLFAWESGYTYSSDTMTAEKTYNDDLDVYEFGVIRGRAASKLTRLRSNSTLVDDVGDPIEGRYNVSGKTNHQPPEGEILDLLYESGNTANILPFPSAGEGYYYGDMITSMIFYYLDYEGNRWGETEWSGSSLNTIINIPTSEFSAYTDLDIVYCDIEYVIGATFSGTEKYEDGLFVGMEYTSAGTEFSQGVKYRETVKFVKTPVEYKLARGKEGQIPTTFNSVSAHSLCYPVVCYILEQDKEEIRSDFDTLYTYPVADFEMKLPPNSGWSGYSRSTEIFPVFRQEYLFGSSTMQNLDVDIYIERGINAAFEKHLKLGEVTSMEALEQYTNGYFKMMEN